MIPSTYIYAIIYFKNKLDNNEYDYNLKENLLYNWFEYKIYIGITNDMRERQFQHNDNRSITTRRFNKSYTLLEIFYTKLPSRETAEIYERYLKKVNKQIRSMILYNWKKWTG